MNRRGLIAAGLAAPMLSGCDMIATSSLRYRLRLDFTVNGDSKSGESVIKLGWRDNRMFGVSTPGPQFVAKVWGEAVVVDMGERHGYLFALLHEKFPVEMVETVLARALPNQTVRNDPYSFLRAIKAEREEVPLIGSDLPMLVAFGDLADPRSVYEVEYEDLLSRYDGAVVFVGASVQQTQQRVTNQIRRILPWLDGLSGTMLDGEKNRWRDRGFANKLHQGDFLRSGS